MEKRDISSNNVSGLSHLKEKNHNKSFYQLCQHMMPNYHQVEFDLRVFNSVGD
ncbi:MAG: M48 family metallopeptidase [Alteromonadaceae bacterium]|nr:M48 family metallopeptidase [Alteromonadaceae bacterium]